MKKIIVADAAPDAIGPYSHGTAYGDLIFTSGQLPVCKQQGGVVEGGIEAQSRQALENLKHVLEAAGATWIPCSRPPAISPRSVILPRSTRSINAIS